MIACGPSPAPDADAYLAVELEPVGSAACAGCHQAEHQAWKGSHHDLAMQEAGVATVLGDFDDASFEHFGVTTTFYRRGEELRVRTEGPDGEPADYRIAYTFGVDPLQQYLIELPGGRLQAFTVAWDTRPAAAGGQRWFHLYPGERLAPGHRLHWTGLDQNWNYMCAECHSTGLVKGYDAATDTYETTWDEIDVACEACHGPGSRHAAWAEAVEAGRLDEGMEQGSMGLAVTLSDPDEPVWSFDESGIARRRPRRTSRVQLETCGRCHSRRSVLRAPYVHGRPLLDTHRVALLTEGLYHPDGQILEEVYVYGSFLQSRMYAEGVTCSDCHDPHSAQLLNQGNAVCARCHLPARYDTPEHHRHRRGESGSACVECHMRSQTYMVVDPRRDHSFRVPRPDLSLTLGTPSACADCHRQESPEWLAERFTEWYPERAARPHWGTALDAGRKGGAGADGSLRAVVGDSGQPAIVRATALELLASRSDPGLPQILERAARDPDPLVRMAAAEALAGVHPAARREIGRPLLEDPLLAVRAAAAHSFLGTPAELLDGGDLRSLHAARAELDRTLRVNADRPGARVVLGLLRAAEGDSAAALAEYRKALALDPASVEARVNLADLYRATGREAAAEETLREALALAPENADVHHALGLALTRRGATGEAIAALERAAELAPDNLRYGYVHAVALGSAGRTREAIGVLEGLHPRWPSSAELLVALSSYQRQRGDLARAEAYARKLVELAPHDPQARALLGSIQAERR